MLLLIISFIAGILTVLAPCILPLLPVIVGGSLSGDAQQLQKKKVLTIVVSLGLSVILFTLLLKVSTFFITIPAYVWTIISGGIIIIFGLVTIFPSLWEGKMMAKLNIKSNKLLTVGDRKKSFAGDVIIGAALGPVFSTCSPTYFIILATVLPAEPVLGIIYLLTYTLGLCLALCLIAFVGQKIMGKLNIVANPDGWIKKGFGVLFVLVGVAILLGYDKKLETTLINNSFDITKVEQKLLSLTDTGSKAIDQNNLQLAPEIVNPSGFINTDGKPITLAELHGKVVLLDIWTYSCINCQRSLPHIEAWYEKYKDKGLVVIGLHTPEFAFEKVQGNVEEAVKRLGITYPVVLDNDYSTWNAYQNQYWPRKYLINKDGYIVYDHAGEGDYETTEKEIQKALGITDTIDKAVDTVDASAVNSPETYFGASRNMYLENGNAGISGNQTMAIPQNLSKNKLYLGGTWNFAGEYAQAESSSSIAYMYDAKSVYFVGGSDTPVTLSVYQDGVFVKDIVVKDEKLYTIIDGAKYGTHRLDIQIKGKGLKAFTFTFG